MGCGCMLQCQAVRYHEGKDPSESDVQHELRTVIVPRQLLQFERA